MVSTRGPERAPQVARDEERVGKTTRLRGGRESVRVRRQEVAQRSSDARVRRRLRLRHFEATTPVRAFHLTTIKVWHRCVSLASPLVIGVPSILSRPAMGGRRTGVSGHTVQRSVARRGSDNARRRRADTWSSRRALMVPQTGSFLKFGALWAPLSAWHSAGSERLTPATCVTE